MGHTQHRMASLGLVGVIKQLELKLWADIMLCIIQEAQKRQNQLEFAHNMLLRHHESTQDLEYKHLNSIHRLRDEQQGKQHRTELLNQKEYSKRAQRELKNRHSMEVKQQPKSLKVNIMKWYLEYWGCIIAVQIVQTAQPI